MKNLKITGKMKDSEDLKLLFEKAFNEVKSNVCKSGCNDQLQFFFFIDLNFILSLNLEY